MVSKRSVNTLVVGGGFGGIAAALRCKALGHNVTLVERLDKLGGRAQVLKIDGYKHDMGPTVITAPFLFQELFQLFDENLDDHLEFVPVSPWYRFVFHNGKEFNYSGDETQMDEEIAKFSTSDVKNYKRLLQASKKIFDVGFSKLAHVPFLTVWSMMKQIPNLIRLRADRTVSQFVKHYIENPLLQRAFSIHPLLVGGNPYSTTSIYSLIHYLEKKWGIFFCKGGTGELVEKLTELMERHGIIIKYNTEVEKLSVSDNRVTCAYTKTNEKIKFDNIICNADPPMVYKNLLKMNQEQSMGLKKWFPSRLTNYSMGLYVFFFGTTIKYENVAHHTIWLTERFEELLSDIFDRKTLTEDFSLYIHRPTATDTSFAPPNCDSFYVLCPVPNLQASIDWDIEGKRLRDRIVMALSKTILPKLEDYIIAEHWMTPREFKENYRCAYGAGFSISPNLTQSAWFRYHNVDTKLQNLYFVGAGTHPGAGLPGVLSSAKVAEYLLKKEA